MIVEYISPILQKKNFKNINKKQALLKKKLRPLIYLHIFILENTQYSY